MNKKIHQARRKSRRKEAATNISRAEIDDIYEDWITVGLGSDSEEILERLSKVPLEDRYVWRVLAGLEFAFDDFNPSFLEADVHSLGSLEQGQRVFDHLRRRPLQFCQLMAAILGPDLMAKVISEAIEQACEDSAFRN